MNIRTGILTLALSVLSFSASAAGYYKGHDVTPNNTQTVTVKSTGLPSTYLFVPYHAPHFSSSLLFGARNGYFFSEYDGRQALHSLRNDCTTRFYGVNRCIEKVERAELDLTPPAPPAPTKVKVVPPAPVKPENG